MGPWGDCEMPPRPSSSVLNRIPEISKSGCRRATHLMLAPQIDPCSMSLQAPRREASPFIRRTTLPLLVSF
jgi:hypothetical protein